MSDFHTAMKAAHVSALWEVGIHANAAPERSYIWRWKTMDPLLDAAVRATSMGNAERRVLMLNNPLPNGENAESAIPNLCVNLQVLMPGERARPHRHSMHALRFVVEGEGVNTIVEGKPCPMLPGDMILTPSMTWHEHEHIGEGRVVWVDALDVPLQKYLDNSRFEPGPSYDLLDLPPDSAFTEPGLMPVASGVSTPYSPLFRYSWESAVRALNALPPSADGSRTLRYTNPLTGGSIMPTIDCYMVRLEQGRETQRRITNCNSAIVVAEGEGSSTVGGETLEWTRNDIFTVPHGQPFTHKASSASAKLFQITDREIFRRLDLLREEQA